MFNSQPQQEKEIMETLKGSYNGHGDNNKHQKQAENLCRHYIVKSPRDTDTNLMKAHSKLCSTALHLCRKNSELLKRAKTCAPTQAVTKLQIKTTYTKKLKCLHLSPKCLLGRGVSHIGIPGARRLINYQSPFIKQSHNHLG